MVTSSDLPESCVPDGNRLSAQVYVNLHRAYLEASDELRAVIDRMAEIYNDPAADPEERESALDTLTDALFPWNASDGELGAELPNVKVKPQDGSVPSIIESDMQAEEATFATRLAGCMEHQGLTQTELAAKTGVRQSAIAMMLSRECRPQRRTVAKLAEALGVEPADLWPAFNRQS